MVPKRSELKLRKSCQFLRVYETNNKIAQKHVVILSAIRNESTEITRFGITVSKKVGKACVRNKIKRRLREIFFCFYSELKPGFDIVFIARKSIVEIGFGELKNEVNDGFIKLNLFREENPGTDSNYVD